MVSFWGNSFLQQSHSSDFNNQLPTIFSAEKVTWNHLSASEPRFPMVHMKVSCLFLFLSTFFLPFSLFPYPFSFLWGVWWRWDWLSLLRWCGGMLQSNFVAFFWGVVASKRMFFFFFWGSFMGVADSKQTHVVVIHF